MQLGFQKQKTENFLQWKTQKCIYLQLLITVLKIKYEFVNGYKIVYFIYIYIYIYTYPAKLVPVSGSYIRINYRYLPVPLYF